MQRVAALGGLVAPNRLGARPRRIPTHRLTTDTFACYARPGEGSALRGTVMGEQDNAEDSGNSEDSA